MVNWSYLNYNRAPQNSSIEMQFIAYEGKSPIDDIFLLNNCFQFYSMHLGSTYYPGNVKFLAKLQ